MTGQGVIAAEIAIGGFKWTGNFTTIDLIAATTNALNGALLARRPDHYKNFTIVGILLMALLGGIGATRWHGRDAVLVLFGAASQARTAELFSDQESGEAIVTAVTAGSVLDVGWRPGNPACRSSRKDRHGLMAGPDRSSWGGVPSGLCFLSEAGASRGGWG